MKAIKFARLAFFASLLLVCFGCGDDYLDINDNPNSVTRPPLNGLLAQASYATAINNYSVSASHTSTFVQYLASPNVGSNTDTYLEVSGGGAWSQLYNTMTDLYDLIRYGEEEEALAHVGIGKVLMAVNLGLVVDNWGEAPYSDAFTGQTLRPMYDSQESLYDEIFSLLDEAEVAFDNFDGTPPINAGSDFIYGATGEADLDLWRKTISALRARYLNHLSETDQYDPEAVLNAVDNSYTSYEEDADLSTFLTRNPWSQVAINNASLSLGGWLSDQFIDALNGDTYAVFDPRLPFLTDTTIYGDYRGTVNGAGRVGDGTVPEETYLTPGFGPAAEGAPVDIITYAEIKFIEAEAALATGDQIRANEAFRAGVRASMAETGVAEEDIDAYLSEAYGDDSNDIDVDDVFREKYVALFLHPETWTDARRYDFNYADMTLAENASLNTFPVRLIYPNSELDRNAANVPEVVMTDNLFWDQ